MLNAKLVVVGGDAKAAEVRLKLPTIIGRGKEAGLTVPHALVSRRHSEILERDGRLYVRDLGSLNGTFVNNHRIESEQPLDPNQLLTLGNITFRAVYEVSESAVDTGVVAPIDETVSLNDVKTESGQAKSDSADTDSAGIVSSDEEALASLDGLVAFDETIPVDSIPAKPHLKPGVPERASAVNAKQSGEPRADEPLAESAAQSAQKPEEVLSEPVANSSSLESNKSSIGSEVMSGESATASSIFSFDDKDTNPANKSISVSALGDLPDGQSAVSFVADLDLGKEGAIKPDGPVEPVEIDLGDESEPKAVTESSLGSFLKKLPR